MQFRKLSRAVVERADRNPDHELVPTGGPAGKDGLFKERGAHAESRRTRDERFSCSFAGIYGASWDSVHDSAPAIFPAVHLEDSSRLVPTFFDNELATASKIV